MKKVFLSAVTLICVVLILAGADFRKYPLIHAGHSPRCGGYTIIEFDKGVDCNGDTIKLVRQNGFAQRAGR